jgi:hypothetical protein
MIEDARRSRVAGLVGDEIVRGAEHKQPLPVKLCVALK